LRAGRRLSVLAAGAAALAIAVPVATAHPDRRHHHEVIRHVVLISVDGLHQSDLAWYAQQHPGSELAKLAYQGAQFTRARTPVPSDSFPGMVGQVTGGDPSVTGIYYDASYNSRLLPPGTTSCQPGAATGTAVNYDESVDKDPSSIDAGQGLSGLPGSILQLTGSPQTLIDPAALPVDPRTCAPIYPHQYLKVNTVFEIARAHGLRTAWSDKHPAYDILNGPSGTGIQDLFTPEINSDAIGFAPGLDWTGDNAATQQYDSYKVQAVLNEIDGYDHGRTAKVGVPAIFGMNFQTVSTAQKLPTSDGLTGGYLPGTTTPGPLLSRALDYIDAKLQAIDDELHTQGLADSTAIILSAKHGQSPEDPTALTRIDDAPIIDAINAAWKSTHPGAADLIVGGTDDDAWQSYLSDRSQQAADFVKNYLLTHPATGNTVDGSPRTLQSSGLVKVFAGKAAARYFHVPVSDPRHPDVWGIVQHGVVYTGGKKKIAEHGGADPNDRDVPLVVYAPGVIRPEVVGRRVETTQIAPTILRLLGLDPDALQAVRIEGTEVLPGI
jgi:Type I phosphodiesterase / nucleotide pyrophosphatase